PLTSSTRYKPVIATRSTLSHPNTVQRLPSYCSSFLQRHTAPPAICTLSLHDALPIWDSRNAPIMSPARSGRHQLCARDVDVNVKDRKSTRLNSSHVKISYAVFCLKKKRKNKMVDAYLDS